MNRKPQKIAFAVIVLAVAAGAWAWSRLPYRRLPLDNSHPAPQHDSQGLRVLRPTVADLPYATESRFEKLDIYLPPETSAPVPVVIWIHGGGLVVGDKRSMPRTDFSPTPKAVGAKQHFQVQVPDVNALTAKGYAVVSLNYRLGMSLFTDLLPAVRDGKAAVRFLRANASTYHLDPSKFAVWGNSMGGYMAAMIGVTGDQPSGFDDAHLGDTSVSSAVQAVVVWFGAEDRLPVSRFRIGHYIPTAHTLPPFLIAAGDADPVISPAQSKRLNDALLAAGGVSSLTILHGAGHEDPAYTATQMTPTIAFLDRIFGRQ